MGANPAVAGKAAGNTSNVGDVQKAQVPTFTAILRAGESNYTRAFQGVSCFGAARETGAAKTGNFEYYGMKTDTSEITINPVFGGSTDHLGDNVYFHNGEVRTANIRMNYIIKY